MRKKGFAKVILPPNPSLYEILDQHFLETGRIQAVEINPLAILIWDDWETSDELIDQLKEFFPNIPIERVFVPDQDWNQTWIEGFQPQKIGKIWITPPWHRDKIPMGEQVVTINPGSAFGTGTHESTRLSLLFLQIYLDSGDHVLDLGCGSGILAIAAFLLGASSVYACDNDPQIEINIRENLELNGNPPIQWEVRDVFSLPSYACDWAMINIQKPVIFPLLEKFASLPVEKRPKNLILSGLLIDDEKVLEAYLTNAGYERIQTQIDGEWLAMCATQKT
ncbi:MAG: 50S ribosomal protein L11 methyltransferase [Candidatus Marinimicrobia bacterium]|nr:50S ribosomal protein L11 methyltransferase [Candidatus Neomarinimicrobiota bacterium]